MRPLSARSKFRFRLERDVSDRRKDLTHSSASIHRPQTRRLTTPRYGSGLALLHAGRLAIHYWYVSPARSTDVKGLATILVSNDVWQKTSTIKAIAAEADILVPCWGDQKKRRDIWLTILQNGATRVLRATGGQ